VEYFLLPILVFDEPLRRSPAMVLILEFGVERLGTVISERCRSLALGIIPRIGKNRPKAVHTIAPSPGQRDFTMSQLGCVTDFPQSSMVGHIRSNKQLKSNGLQGPHGKCHLDQPFQLSPDRRPLIGDHIKRMENQDVRSPGHHQFLIQCAELCITLGGIGRNPVDYRFPREFGRWNANGWFGCKT
jgi:hypothetical protein